VNIRDTLKALVDFLREGHQSGNTTAALHGVANAGPAPGRDWEYPRLVYLTEQDARRSMQAYKVPCMSLSDPHRVRTARPGPVVFDTWTVEQLAEKALQRIQFLEGRLEKAEAERDLFKREMITLANNARSPSPQPSADVVVVSRELLADVEDALGCAEGLGPCGLGLLCQVQDAIRAHDGVVPSVATDRKALGMARKEEA
jgi:hypothetical protein